MRPCKLCWSVAYAYFLSFFAVLQWQAWGQPSHPQSHPPPFLVTFLYIITPTTARKAIETRQITTMSKGPICSPYTQSALLVGSFFFLLKILRISNLPVFLNTIKVTTAAMTASQMNTVHHQLPTV